MRVALGARHLFMSYSCLISSFWYACTYIYTVVEKMNMGKSALHLKEFSFLTGKGGHLFVGDQIFWGCQGGGAVLFSGPKGDHNFFPRRQRGVPEFCRRGIVFFEGVALKSFPPQSVCTQTLPPPSICLHSNPPIDSNAPWYP